MFLCWKCSQRIYAFKSRHDIERGCLGGQEIQQIPMSLFVPLLEFKSAEITTTTPNEATVGN
jgi:hypothetical protein